MARYKDVEGYRKLFDEEYKKTRELIYEGETHLDNLAEGFSEASRVIDRMPGADVVPKSEVERLEHLRAELSKEIADLQDALECEKETNKHLSDEYISAQKEIARLEKASLPSYFQAVSEEEAIKIGKEYGKREVAREIFEEIYEECFDQFGYINYEALAELKKKYTEDIE